MQDPDQELRVLYLKVLPDLGIGPFDGNFLIQLNKPHDGFTEMNITKIVDSDYTTNFVIFSNVYRNVKHLTVPSTFDGLLSSGPPPRLKHTDLDQVVKGGEVNV
ncbi:MAG: hypothetical protein ACKO5Q_13210 [Microcystaceae cyanobacterium]